jgi:hypothetical protein
MFYKYKKPESTIGHRAHADFTTRTRESPPVWDKVPLTDAIRCCGTDNGRTEYESSTKTIKVVVLENKVRKHNINCYLYSENYSSGKRLGGRELRGQCLVPVDRTAVQPLEDALPGATCP